MRAIKAINAVKAMKKTASLFMALLTLCAALMTAVYCSKGGVRIIDRNADGGTSFEATSPDGEAPLDRVTGLAVNDADGAAVLCWDVVPDADGYCVFLRTKSRYQTYQLSDTPTLRLTGLKNGAEYVFAVAAYILKDGKEICGPRSEDVTVTRNGGVSGLSETCLVLKTGETRLLSCLMNGKSQKASWSSADPEIASVDADGTVRALKKGSTVVTAEKDGVKSTCAVYVDRMAPKPQVDTSARYTKDADGVYRQNASGGSGSALLMFTGDLMATRDQMRAAKKEDGCYDFSPSFARVSPLLHEADLVVGNLETVISESFPYSIDAPRYASGANRNTVSSYLDALKTAGYDLLLNANDHYCDAGPLGVVETLGHLDKYNFIHIGAYRSAKDSRVAVVEVNGIRVGFLNYNQKSVNGRDAAFTEKQATNMLGKFYRSRVPKDIDAARKLGAEFIVVCIHYGTQDATEVNETQESINKYLADCGADLIVGTHPHVLQKVLYVTASDGRPVPVVSSLGNFCSSMDGLPLYTCSAILNVTLKKQGKDVLISELSCTPCSILPKTGEGRYVITPTYQTDGLTDKQLADLAEAEKSIAQALGNQISERKH